MSDSKAWDLSPKADQYLKQAEASAAVLQHCAAQPDLLVRLLEQAQEIGRLKAELTSATAQVRPDAEKLSPVEVREAVVGLLMACSQADKIRAIKWVRRLTGMYLKDAKDLAESYFGGWK